MVVIDGEDVDPADVEFDLAQAVYDRVRAEHRKCDEESCPLSRMWLEDVEEIIETIKAVQS